MQVLDVTEISEESSSSDASKSGGNSDNAGAGTEIVELVSLDELPSKKARHESETDISDDDDISQLMSETGVVMVTDEKSHVTRESYIEIAGGLAPTEVVFSDDEGTDSCEEFEGFLVMSSRDQTPDRSTGQLPVCI